MRTPCKLQYWTIRHDGHVGHFPAYPCKSAASQAAASFRRAFPSHRYTVTRDRETERAYGKMEG